MSGIRKYVPVLVAGLCAAPAWSQAQEAAPEFPPAIPVPPPAAEPAAAPPREGDDEKLATIVVEARRRSERSQDVPTAVSSVTGESLEAQGVAQVQDFQQMLPSLNAAYGQARQSSLAVRGIGNNPANEGLESSVGIYLDDVFYGRPGMAVQDLADIEQVDLLRGPQGTLFGKNTTAGVLNIKSRKPTATPEGTLETTFGERNGSTLRGTLSGPLSDRWGGRIVLAAVRDDGWVKNIDDGSDLNAVDRMGGRGQLMFAGDGIELRFIGDYARSDDSQGAAVITGAGPARPHFRNLQEMEEATGADPSPTDPDRYEMSVDGPVRSKARQGGASADLEMELGEYTLSAIGAGRFWNFSPHNDVDFTNAPVIDDYGVSVKDKQFSQEIRLASPTGGTIDYVVGAYYYRQDIRDHLLIDFGPDADAGLLPTALPVATDAGTVWLPVNIADAGLQILSNARSDNYGKVLTNSGSLFGQGNCHMTERLALTLGLRGTYEKKKGRVYRTEPETAVRYTTPPFGNVQDQQIGPWDSDDEGGLKLHELSPSALATLSWQVADDHLLYATVSHGEKSGGFNVNGVGSGPALGIESLEVDPEKANNFELGYKSTWLDEKLRANFNVFDTLVTGYQSSVNVTEPGQVLPIQVLTNVGKVESYGFEWDMRGLLARGLIADLNGAWTHATYKSFHDAPCPAETNPDEPESCDLTGERVQGAPRWIVNTSVLYHVLWQPDLGQQFAVNYAWRSGTSGSLDNSTYARIPSYDLLNVSTTLRWSRPDADEWEVSLWCRNLLDQHYILAAGAIVNAIYVGSPGTPRTVGLTLRYRF